jgi:hypothetical protein
VLATFTITQQVSTLHRRSRNVFLAAWTGLATLPFGLLWIGGSRRRASLRYGLALIALLFILLLGGCSSNSYKAPAPTAVQSSLPIALTVVVDN